MKKLRIAALAAIPVLCLLLILLISDLTRSETELPILMYHHLAEEGPYNTMTISPERFRSDMEWLRDNGFTCLLPSDLVKIRAGEMKMPDRPVMITFDDGYNSTYELAFPILVAIGNLVDPPATMINSAGDYVVCYIVSRFVDGKDWLQKALAAKKEG